MKQLPTDRTVTYQQQFRRCGKPKCHCNNGGAKHGPYFYAYWHDDDGRLKSFYVGKELPKSQEG